VHPRAPVAQHTACGASGRQRETTSATWQAARTMPATWQAYRCVLDFDGPLARTAMQRCTQRALNGTINEVPTKGMLRVHSGYTPGMQGRCSNSTQGVVQRGFRRCTQRVLKGYSKGTLRTHPPWPPALAAMQRVRGLWSERPALAARALSLVAPPRSVAAFGYPRENPAAAITVPINRNACRW
jgi:hypothetical protein